MSNIKYIKEKLSNDFFTAYNFNIDGFIIDGYLSKIEYPYSKCKNLKYQNLNQLIEMKERIILEKWTSDKKLKKVKNSLDRLKNIKEYGYYRSLIDKH